jgi:sulfotransferase family protein
MPDRKELHFFVTEKNWNQGLEWYERHFDGAGDAIAVGEASTSYTRFPGSLGVAARIGEVLPKARLIYLVRHPIERMISQYKFNVSMHWEKRPVDALKGNSPYLNCSRYATQVEQYLEHFPLDRLLIIKSEDLRDSRAATVRRVFRFLGVDETWLPANLDEESNHTAREVRAPRKVARVIARVPGYKSVASIAPPSLKELKRRLTMQSIGPDFVLSESVRRDLEEQLRPEMQRLRTYMEDDFDGWGIG